MRKIKILIVEDEAIVAKDTENMLDSLGYKIVEIVTNGIETLKKIEEIQPDLVLMDIVLTGNIDGIQIAEQIRDQYNIPVIYVTAYADNNTLQRAKITDPFGYIIKPFEERELASTIEMALYKHKIETKLKESEERFRSVVETANDAIISIDSQRKIISWNKAAENIFGYSPDDAVGKPLTFIIPERFQKAFQKGVNRVVSTGKTKIIGKTVEFEGLRKDGSEFPIDLSVALWKTGENIFFTGIIRDITERKKSEEELEKRLRELETYYKVSIGRETRIIELKHQVNELLEQLGKEKKFKV
ncbi:MAG: PAS domain S-box protein [Candidatus Cloacimonetes bacterium]|nr:PAS domain S-box protein [Candidatus Cloacimonadota bacterium]